MGSHYIPVGKIKIDKEILDIVCPAAGYDETPPPPEIYCPANGYAEINVGNIDSDGLPEVTPPTGDDEIIVVIGDYYPVSGSISLTRTAGNLYWELYGDGDTLLDSGNQATNIFSYNTSLLEGGYVGNGVKYYKYIFKTAENEHFTSFANCPQTTVQIFVNAPYLTTLTIHTLNFLYELWLCDTMHNLTSSVNLCQYTPELRKITLPSSMPNLTTVTYWFRGSGITELIWECYCPALTNLSYLGYASKIRNANINLELSPTNVGGIGVDASRILQGSEIIDARINFVTPSNITSSYILSDCAKLKYFKLSSNFYFTSGTLTNSPFANTDDSIFELYPPNPQSYNNQNMLTANIMIKKMIFGENHLGCQSGIAVIAGLGLEEIVFLAEEMSTSGTAFTTLMGTTKLEKLKKITLPQKISAPNLNNTQVSTFWGLGSFYPNLEELSSFEAVDFEFGVPGTSSGHFIFTKLKRFDQPALHFYSNMNINRTSGSPGSLEYFDIDFEKSFVEGCSTTVNFSYQQFDATELNRIFTKFPDSAVPTGSGLLRIQITGNPGAATCDRTIVENKGWTVLG